MYSIKESSNIHFRQPQLNLGRSNFQFDFFYWFLIVRHMCVIWFLFLVKEYLYLMSVCLAKDQRKNTIKTHVRKRLDYAFIMDLLIHLKFQV